MVVTLCVESFSEEVIGKLASLGEAVDTFSDFEVHPAVLDKLVEVAFGDELLWDVGQLDADVFVAFKGSIKITVFDVKNNEFGSAAQKDAIEEELDKFEGSCGCADVTREANAVATNGDAGAVGVGLVGLDFANNARVGDLLAAVGGDVGVVDGKECVSTWGALAGAVRTYTHPLAEATEFVGVRGVPDIPVLGVLAQLAVAEGLAGFIHDGQGPGGEEAGGVAAAGGGLRGHNVGEVLQA